MAVWFWHFIYCCLVTTGKSSRGVAAGAGGMMSAFHNALGKHAGQLWSTPSAVPQSRPASNNKNNTSAARTPATGARQTPATQAPRPAQVRLSRMYVC